MPTIGGVPVPEQLVRVYDVNARQLEASKVITGATNATPIEITSTAHGFANGDLVLIEAVGGNTAANGWRLVKTVAANTFEITDLAGVNVSGNGAYTAGGTAKRLATSATVANAVVSSREIWITRVRLANTTGVGIAFTLTDNLSGGSTPTGPNSKYPGVSVSLNAVSLEQSDDSPPMLCQGGAVFYSAATGLNVEIEGWRKPNFT